MMMSSHVRPHLSNIFPYNLMLPIACRWSNVQFVSMLLFIIPGVFDYRAEPAIADHGDGQCSGMINPQDAPSVVFGVPEGIGAISERGHTVRTGSKETKVQIDPSLMLVVTIHGPNEPFVSLAPCQHDDFPRLGLQHTCLVPGDGHRSKETHTVGIVIITCRTVCHHLHAALKDDEHRHVVGARAKGGIVRLFRIPTTLVWADGDVMTMGLAHVQIHDMRQAANSEHVFDPIEKSLFVGYQGYHPALRLLVGEDIKSDLHEIIAGERFPVLWE